jgi:hypothetical protein
MTREEAIATVENEKRCVNRASKNDNCNRDCYNCELVKTDAEILEAFDMAIKALKQESREDEVILTKNEYGELVSSEFDNGYAKGYREALEQEDSVLGKIRAEIEQNAYPIVHGVNNHEKGMTLYGILQIIDKYKVGE